MSLLWYGLTEEEAVARCRKLQLSYSFSATRDPKAADAPGARTATAAAGADRPALIPKVIRAKEEGGAMHFLLGYFAPAHTDHASEGER